MTNVQNSTPTYLVASYLSQNCLSLLVNTARPHGRACCACCLHTAWLEQTVLPRPTASDGCGLPHASPSSQCRACCLLPCRVELRYAVGPSRFLSCTVMLLLLTVTLKKRSNMSFLKGGVEEIQCSAPHVQSCQDSHVTYQALAMYISNLAQDKKIAARSNPFP